MPFRNEENLPKRMNRLVSNCKTHNVISDKIAVTIYSTIQNWAPSNWENFAKRSIYDYAIFMYSACRLVITELMQQCQEMNLAQMAITCKRILQKRQWSYRVLPGIYGFMVGWLSIWWFAVTFLCSICILIYVFCDCESFWFLLESQHPLSEISTYFR